MRPYVERIVSQRFAPQHLAKEAQQSLAELATVVRELPLEIQQVVHAARRGKLRVHLDHERLDFFAHVTDRASNRIAFSVIAGALIIGSSMLLATDAGAKTLGFAGFTIAGALGVALLISIIRSRNY
jgi:ubiquinone biosynthesis protein